MPISAQICRRSTITILDTCNPRSTFLNLQQNKQEKIITTAVAEFAEKGYTGSSINAIVQRIGIAKGSVFQYFGDKKGLFLYVFINSMEKVKNYLREVRDETQEEPLQLRIEKTLKAGVRFIHEHPLVYRLYVKIISESSIPFREEILLALRSYSLEYIRSLLETALKKEEIRENLDIDKAAFVMDAVMDRFLQSRILIHLDAGLGIYAGKEPETEAWIKSLVEIMLYGVADQA